MKNSYLISFPRGLTLFELLSVVAILAILTVAALPIFREAAVRSKVSRVRGDMHTVSTAINIYAVDYNDVPDTPELGTLPGQLSTPVTYLSTTIWPDPFYKLDPNEPVDSQNRSYRYNHWETDPEESDNYSGTMRDQYGSWSIYSNPPEVGGRQPLTTGSDLTIGIPYDVTNGVISTGRLYRSEKRVGS